MPGLCPICNATMSSGCIRRCAVFTLHIGCFLKERIHMDDRNIKKIETEKLYRAKLTIKNQSYIVYLTEQNIKQNEVIPELNIYGIIECHRPIRHFCLTKNTNISQCTVITKDILLNNEKADIIPCDIQIIKIPNKQKFLEII